MHIALEAGDGSCTLTETTNSSSNRFTIPIDKAALQTALRVVLTDPERRDIYVDGVMFDHYRDGLRVNTHLGRFDLPYRHVLPIVLKA